MSDIEIINRLEVYSNRDLKKYELNELYSAEDEIFLRRNAFAIDSNNKVIALSLSDIRKDNWDFFSSLKQLSKLKKLQIFNCLISELAFLEEMSTLETLDLDINNITNIDILANLANLKSLRLNQNKISEISGLKELKKLTLLDLQNNEIKELFQWICEFDNMEIKWIDKRKLSKDLISLSGNPLKRKFIEQIKFGKIAMKDWFQTSKVENNIIKLILLGNSDAGKTSLIKYLFEQEYSPKKSTHGITIYDKKLDNLQIYSWDFGGQEYYHATYKLFLSDTVYILVWDTETNKSDFLDIPLNIEKKNKGVHPKIKCFNYKQWYSIIRNYSEINSPILMVQNKIDNNKGKEEKIKEFFYSNITNYPISVEKAYEFKKYNREENLRYGQLFDSFRTDLLETLKKTAKDIFIQRYFKNILKAIIETAKEHDILNFKTYEKLCIDNAGEKIEGHQIKLVTEYLNKTGMLIYYGYKVQYINSILKKYVFINPSYLANTIYKILSPEILKNDGKFTRDHVLAILNDEIKTDLFIELMSSSNFWLIFKYQGEEDTYITPQYLPEKLSKDAQKMLKRRKLKICFSLSFKNIDSTSFITHFISKYGVDASSDVFWKNGILVENDGEDFLVQKTKSEKITVACEAKNIRHNFLQEIFDTLIEISDNEEFTQFAPNNNDHDLIPLKTWRNHASGKANIYHGINQIETETYLFLSRKHTEIDKSDTHDTSIKKLLFFSSTSIPRISPHLKIIKKVTENTRIDIENILLIEPEKITAELLSYGNSIEFVHFFMHGKENTLIFKEGEKDIEIEHKSIITRFELIKSNKISIKYVFFIVCKTHNLAQEVSKYCEFAIGMNGLIVNDPHVKNEAANEFTKSLYRMLAKKSDIKSAFIEAIINLQDKGFDGSDKIFQYKIPELYQNGKLILNHKILNI